MVFPDVVPTAQSPWPHPEDRVSSVVHEGCEDPCGHSPTQPTPQSCQKGDGSQGEDRAEGLPRTSAEALAVAPTEGRQKGNDPGRWICRGRWRCSQGGGPRGALCDLRQIHLTTRGSYTPPHGRQGLTTRFSDSPCAGHPVRGASARRDRRTPHRSTPRRASRWAPRVASTPPSRRSS